MRGGSRELALELARALARAGALRSSASSAQHAMPKGFKNMKAKAKAKAARKAAKKIYGADVIEAVAEDWCAAPPPCARSARGCALTCGCLHPQPVGRFHGHAQGVDGRAPG